MTAAGGGTASSVAEIVSLNDGKLYGVDLRLRGAADGQLAVSLLPSVGKDSILDAGSPEAALDTFVELIGSFWADNGFGAGNKLAGSLVNARVVKDKGQTYYVYETASPRNLIAANITDGQLYIITASAASPRQWARAEEKLRHIVDTFRVPA